MRWESSPGGGAVPKRYGWSGNFWEFKIKKIQMGGGGRGCGDAVGVCVCGCVCVCVCVHAYQFLLRRKLTLGSTVRVDFAGSMFPIAQKRCVPCLPAPQPLESEGISPVNHLTVACCCFWRLRSDECILVFCPRNPIVAEGGSYTIPSEDSHFPCSS